MRVSVSLTDKIYLVLWVLTGLVCLIIGGTLIWESLMGILHPDPDRNLPYIRVTMIFGILTCCIFLTPAAAVCVELFLNWWKTAPPLLPLFGTKKITPLPTPTSVDGTGASMV